MPGTPHPPPAAVPPPAGPDQDPWDSELLDLDAYLRRVGVDAPVAADGRTLVTLHRAHLAAIPFENLDVVLGRGVAVDPVHVEAKLDGRRRGGYCYEHAVLFGAVLERLGYRVDRLLARTGDPVDHPRPRGHMVLLVAAGQERWLADVGFGSGLLAPLPLAETGPQRQGAWEYELVRGADQAWRLREFDGRARTTVLTFTEEPQYFVDIDAANHHSATHPRSPFVRRPIVVRKDDTSVRRLLGREHSLERPGHPVQERRLTDHEFADVLHDVFGPALSADEVTALVAALPPDTADGPPAPGLPTDDGAAGR